MSEWQKNLIALAIVGLIFSILAYFALRPAIVAGVQEGALTHSVGSAVLSDSVFAVGWSYENGSRVDTDGRRRCLLSFMHQTSGGSGLSGRIRAAYVVDASWNGCWGAVASPSKPWPPRMRDLPKRESGCIDLLDYL